MKSAGFLVPLFAVWLTGCRGAESTNGAMAPAAPAGSAETAGETWALTSDFHQQEAAGEATYTFSVEAGLCLDLALAQLGQDLRVEVYGDDGRQILDVDSPNGDRGIERVLLVAERRETFRLLAKPLDPGEAPGTFGARVQALRSATAADRDLAGAYRALSRARILRRASPSGPAVEEIAAAYRAASRLAHAAGDSAFASEIAAQLGRHLFALPASREEAEAAFQESVIYAEGSGDRRRRARALHDLGLTQARLDRLSRARDTLESSLALWREIGDRQEVGSLVNDLAGVQQRQGQLHLAIESFDEAVTIWQELGMRAAEATSRTNLGILYTMVGDRRQAVLHYRRSLRLLADTREEAARSWVQVRLADALMPDESSQAMALYQEALRSSTMRSDRVQQAFVLNSIGRAERRAQNPRAAVEALMKALGIYLDQGFFREAAPNAVNLAEAFLELGHLERAREQYQNALAWSRRTADEPDELEAQFGLARVERALGRRDLALAHLEVAVGLVEEQRRRPSQPGQRSSYLEARLEVYRLLVELLVESAEKAGAKNRDDLNEQAFAVAERSRARGFLDTLRRTPRRAGGRDRDEAELASLATQIDSLHLRLLEARERTGNQATVYDEALGLALGSYHQVEARLWQLDPRAARPPSTAELRRLLPPGTLLLSYFLAGERSFLWAVDAKEVQLLLLPPMQDLGSPISDLLGRLGRQNDPLQRPVLQLALLEASRQLLGPVAEKLKHAERLVLIPSGILRQLPFAALPDPADPSLPLIASHEIVYLPSATSLVELRRRRSRQEPGHGLAILSDPIFAEDDQRLARLHPEPAPIHRPRLEHLASEVATIRAAAGDGPLLEATDFLARRELLLQGKLDSFRYLHLAGHGFHDELFPEVSSLLLTSYDRDGRVHDGFLRAYEVRGLHLKADLVTLSACETGSPRISGSEGLFGLSRAFFDAGAGSVLMSLWPVHDAATSELMGRFYHHLLANGEPPARALQLAQRSMAEDSAFSEPFFWAAFVLYGHWEPAGRIPNDFLGRK